MGRIRNNINILFKKGPSPLIRKWKARNYGKRKVDGLDKLHLISEEIRLKQKSKIFENPEVISILTPLYNTPPSYLIELLESMKRQTYKHWELCLADGSGKENTEVGKICKEYMDSDSRFKYLRLEKNRGISENTNACLSLATGSYIGLLDHDDLLHESALYEVMCAISETRADFLYTDEVKFVNDITKIKDIRAFNFKPDYGKDELRAHNYICHFTVFHRELLAREGRSFRAEFDGSQDYDMILRLTEKAKKIVHIPKVLYYWRVHKESVSYDLEKKKYAVDAAIRGITEQLEREGEYGEVKSNLPYQTIYRIHYQTESKPFITILHYDTAIESREIEKLNQRAKNAEGKYLVFLQRDVIMEGSSWQTELLMYAQRGDVACVGGKILYPKRKICCAGIALDRESESRVRRLCMNMPDEYQGVEAMLRHVRNTTAVWLGCLMIEKEKFLSLGGLDPQLGRLAEVDLGIKAAKKGLWNVWTPFAVGKYGGQEKEVDYREGNAELLASSWQEELTKGDGFCHPVLKKYNLV